MIALILAGGESTRLANKLLLPLCENRPIVAAAIQHIPRETRTVVAVRHPTDVLIDVLKMLRYNCDFMHCDRGLLHTISLAASEDLVILHGDNIYPYGEDLPDRPCVVARNMPQDQCHHLDHYADYRWKYRDQNDFHAVKAVLSSPWYLLKEQAQRASEYPDLITFLNAEQISPTIRPLDGWADLGTEETYRAYCQKFQAS